MPSPRTILITGASSGIGAALAYEYAGEGVTLLLMGRQAARLAEVAAQCQAQGAAVTILEADVRDAARMHTLIMAADTSTPIDLVIANAGIAADAQHSADDVFAVNVQGVLNTIHPLLPRMMARGQGQVALMSSLASICALPSAPAYSASKAAVRYYGEALIPSLAAHGVALSVICPGWISTPLTDKNNFPMPFIMPASRAATRITHSLSQKKTRISFPRRLYFPLLLLAVLPHFVLRRLLSSFLPKAQKF